jgi:peptidyl-prolyl cis-trans isomerase C
MMSQISKHSIKKKPVKNNYKVKKSVKNKGLVFFSLVLIAILLALILNIDNFNSLFNRGEVIAKVNGNPVYLSTLEDQYSKVPAMYKQIYTKELILEQIISQEVLLQEARVQGVKISKSEMDDLMDEAIEKSGMTKEKFEEVLEKQNSSMDEIREYYEISLVLDKLIEKDVLSNVNVSDEEAKEYYNDNIDLYYNNETKIEVSHILIMAEPRNRTEEEAYVLAQDVLAMVDENHSNFGELAVEYSDDPSAVFNSGNIGYIAYSDVVSDFADAAFALEVGEMSDIVNSSFGYHIILKMGEQKPGYEVFESVKETIKSNLLKDAQQTAVQEYIKKLRDESNIEYFGDYAKDSNKDLGTQSDDSSENEPVIEITDGSSDDSESLDVDVVDVLENETSGESA